MYQSLAEKTDTKLHEGDRGLAFPLLGPFGKVGSLLSELKKKQRDADSYVGYQHSVLEEFGDVLPLWNTLIDGFGNHPPDRGRQGMKRPPWDIVHPGRSWAERLQAAETVSDILRLIRAKNV